MCLSNVQIHFLSLYLPSSSKFSSHLPSDALPQLPHRCVRLVAYHWQCGNSSVRVPPLASLMLPSLVTVVASGLEKGGVGWGQCQGKRASMKRRATHPLQIPHPLSSFNQHPGSALWLVTGGVVQQYLFLLLIAFCCSLSFTPFPPLFHFF